MAASTQARGTFAMRLGEYERRLLELAAERANKPLSVYIREEALRAAREEVVRERGEFAR